jgi:hypothetical protein
MTAHAPSWSLIPEHMIDGVRHYIENGIEPGSFLSAVLQNDLRQAVECADEININRLPDYIRFFYNHAPYGSWGSVEAFNAWIAHRGLSGLEETQENPR